MDERDVIVSKMRRELEDVVKQLERTKLDLLDAQMANRRMAEEMDQMTARYQEMREKYTGLMEGIQTLIGKLNR